MKKRSEAEAVKVVEGSGNVFADLGLPNPEGLQIKAELTRQIYNRITALGLTQQEAGKRLGLRQPDVSKLMAGRYTGFSLERLLGLLGALDIDVEIKLRPGRPRARSAGARKLVLKM